MINMIIWHKEAEEKEYTEIGPGLRGSVLFLFAQPELISTDIYL